ncbi:MAG TPA: hypothetical protein VGN32_11005, partial [Ktedonobacterales bacterium]|nr:hypothetical protein [Ktedonobacterales bacterium]
IERAHASALAQSNDRRARGRPGGGLAELDESSASWPAASGTSDDWADGGDEDFTGERYAASYGADSRADWDDSDEWESGGRGGRGAKGGRRGPRQPPARGGRR